MEIPPNSKLPQRFWDKVEINDQTGCWEWIAQICCGYGIFRLGEKQYKAHRLAYQDLRGEVGNLLVCHHCDNKKCVNPEHLFLGTVSDNTKDSYDKGRLVLPHIKNPPKPKKGQDNHMAKLNDEKVREIRRLYRDGVSSYNLADKFNVSRCLVAQIAYGKKWSHVPYEFSPPKPRYSVPFRNGSKHSLSKLTESEVEEIKRLYYKGIWQNILAKKFNVSRGAIKEIIKGNNWKHVQIKNLEQMSEVIDNTKQ